MEKSRRDLVRGARHGIPIMLGYLSVSFGFGIFAVSSGLSPFVATLISAVNLTSAGQFAGVTVIAAAGTLVELVLTQLVINARYALMSMSLSQKLDPSFSFGHRCVAAFGMTDEIFAVAASQLYPVTPAYMYGLILVSMAGWTGGTVLGAVAGKLLPAFIVSAMGILLYGMFIAIVLPPAKKNRRILFVVGAAALCSVAFYYLVPALSSGFSVIISAVVAAALGAWLFPSESEAGV